MVTITKSHAAIYLQAVVTKKSKYLCLAITVSLNVILLVSARFIPGFAEKYAKQIYPIWLHSLGRITDLLPFSIIEVLLYITLLYVTFSTGKLVLNYYKNKWSDKNTVVPKIFQALNIISFLFLVYTLNCGINYHRDTFVQISDLEMKEYSVEDLTAVCNRLTNDVNLLSKQVQRDANGLTYLSDNVHQMSVRAMQQLGLDYTELSGYYSGPKPVMISKLLSLLNIQGIYSPFTIEANYNKDVMAYNIPFVICHEMAHLKGFMKEEEANFIAYLACAHSGNPELRYSGALAGWIYAMNSLHEYDRDLYQEIQGMLTKEAKMDLTANQDFWNQYEGVTSEISEKVNDTYLKANSQTGGIQSYNNIVDLLVAYYLNS